MRDYSHPMPHTTGVRKRKVAVLGATGTVGQRFISLLAGHPYHRE